MKLKKTSVVVLLCGATVGLLNLQFAPPPPEQPSFEKLPPIPTGYWVQKLPKPLANGNNLAMMIHYVSDAPLPNSIEVYTTSPSTKFHDDGVAPDVQPEDGTYSAYLTEDLKTFTDQVQLLDNAITKQGSFMHFSGHLGRVRTDLPHFNFQLFNSGGVTPLSAFLLNASTCGTSIQKDRSLFITYRGTLEDPTKTYNAAAGTGNPNGCWAFPHLIKEIANTGTTGMTPKQFLHDWVKSILSPGARSATVGSTTISAAAREEVMDFLIDPWLRNCRAHVSSSNPNIGLITSSFPATIDVSNWNTVWNWFDTEIADNAPFRLMAIVNRIDLMGNPAYAGGLGNSGETRFIFTLVTPVTVPNHTEHDHTMTQNDVPFQDGIQPDPTVPNPPMPVRNLDWAGMNVIFEYGNPQTNVCDLRNFAHDWYDLSSSTYTPSDNFVAGYNDNGFNNALAALTMHITEHGLGGSRPNGSLLNRIRTNEKLFFHAFDDQHGPPSAAFDSWHNADWELAQYELDAGSHILKPVPVTNTPQLDANSQTNVVNTSTGPNFLTNSSAVTALRDWAFANKVNVLAGNVVMPTSYTAVGPTSFVAAMTALVSNEQAHYVDFDWSGGPSGNYPGLTGPGSATDLTPGAVTADETWGRMLRNQISINTCQGCHAGETKTQFTHVTPTPYSLTAGGPPQSLDYWSSMPANDQATIDTRFAQQTGSSRKNRHWDPSLPGWVQDPSDLRDNYLMLSLPGGTGNTSTHNPGPGSYFRFQDVIQQRVSPFLTGRGLNNDPLAVPADQWKDDAEQPFVNSTVTPPGTWDDQTDNQLTGLYYVFDPTDQHDGTTDHSTPGPDSWFGYNDLQRRQNFLCQLINSNFFCLTLAPITSTGAGPIMKNAVLAIVSQTSIIPHGID